MSKVLYLIFQFLLLTSFFKLAIFSFISDDVFLLFSIFSSFFIIFKYKFHKNRINNISLTRYRNTKIIYFLFFTVFLSVISSYLVHYQNPLHTLISQRNIYAFVFLLSLYYLQPSIKDISKFFTIITLCTIAIWFIAKTNPFIIAFSEVRKENLLNYYDGDGISVVGNKIVLAYLYYKLGTLNYKKIDIKDVIIIMLLFIFLILYQNRSTLIGIIIAFLYIFYVIKINPIKKIITFLILSCIIIPITYHFLSDIIDSLILESQTQLQDTDYARIRELDFFVFNNTNPIAFIFGNGIPSSFSEYGQKILYLREHQGLYADDIGMLGMWYDFGLLFVGIFIYVIIKILFNDYPLFLKLLCLHILIIPTIFHCWKGEGIILFSLILYLFSFYNSKNSKLCTKKD